MVSLYGLILAEMPCLFYGIPFNLLPILYIRRYETQKVEKLLRIGSSFNKVYQNSNRNEQHQSIKIMKERWKD